MGDLLAALFEGLGELFSELFSGVGSWFVDLLCELFGAIMDRLGEGAKSGSPLVATLCTSLLLSIVTLCVAVAAYGIYVFCWA